LLEFTFTRLETRRKRRLSVYEKNYFQVKFKEIEAWFDKNVQL